MGAKAVANKRHPVIVVGAGPAGLSAAIYLRRGGLEALTLERALPGGQVINTHEIANYPGFPDGISGADLVSRMHQQALRFGAQIETAEASAIEKSTDGFLIRTSAGEYQAEAVILASGSTPRKLGAPGEREFLGRGVSYCGTCDAPFFKGKDVVSIGGGDVALEEAIHLAKFARSVAMVHRRDRFRGTQILQDQVKRLPNVSFALESVVESISGADRVESVALRNVKTSKRSELAAEGVFIFVGYRPNSASVRDLAELDEAGAVVTDSAMETSQEGLYAAGDVRKNSFRQIVTASGDGATAAMILQLRSLTCPPKNWSRSYVSIWVGS